MPYPHGHLALPRCVASRPATCSADATGTPARAIAPGLAPCRAVPPGGGGGDSTSAALPAGCHEAHKPPPKHVSLKPPHSRVKPSQSLVAAVDTSCGRFEIALDTRDSPKTVNSFVYLARKGVYANTIFHRIVPNFVIRAATRWARAPAGPATGGRAAPANVDYRRGRWRCRPKGAAGPPEAVLRRRRPTPACPSHALLGKVSGSDVVDRSRGSATRRAATRHAARDRGDPEDRGRQGQAVARIKVGEPAPISSSRSETAPTGSATIGAAGSCQFYPGASRRVHPAVLLPRCGRPPDELDAVVLACPRNRSTYERFRQARPHRAAARRPRADHDPAYASGPGGLVRRSIFMSTPRESRYRHPPRWGSTTRTSRT